MDLHINLGHNKITNVLKLTTANQYSGVFLSAQPHLEAPLNQ